MGPCKTAKDTIWGGSLQNRKKNLSSYTYDRVSTMKWGNYILIKRKKLNLIKRKKEHKVLNTYTFLNGKYTY